MMDRRQGWHHGAAGMEVQTREEVHLLCLFDTLEQVRGWQQVVYAHLPSLKNKEQVFGTQVCWTLMVNGRHQ